MAKKASGSESKTYREQMWLGQILSDIGIRAKNEGLDVPGEKLLEEAEKAFRSATELEPKLPETWLSLVQFLQSNQESAKAEKVVEEAGKKISPEQASLALAQAFEILEKTDLAKEKYEAALAASPENLVVVRAISGFYLRSGKLAAAEAQLRRILDGKVKAEKQDVYGARRQLALIYVMARRPQ